MAAIDFVIEVMSIADYDSVRALLEYSPGLTLRAADSREATMRYLARNPGLSFVARSGGRIVGCVMCGHDGRRGYLQHLAVDPDFRRSGIGTALVGHCLEALHRFGVEKTHIDVFAGNADAHEFWLHAGWKQRTDVVRYSFNASADPNA